MVHTFARKVIAERPRPTGRDLALVVRIGNINDNLVATSGEVLTGPPGNHRTLLREQHRHRGIQGSGWWCCVTVEVERACTGDAGGGCSRHLVAVVAILHIQNKGALRPHVVGFPVNLHGECGVRFTPPGQADPPEPRAQLGDIGRAEAGREGVRGPGAECSPLYPGGILPRIIAAAGGPFIRTSLQLQGTTEVFRMAGQVAVCV